MVYQDHELLLAELLIEYESHLAEGGFDAPTGVSRSTLVSPDDLARLENAKQCLVRLERLWPHATHDVCGLPESIDRFRIVRELGHGGFGIVYLAFDEKLERHVALKVQRPEALFSTALRERFVREARAAARLEHPNIAGVFEVNDAGFRVWIAREYVEGSSLAAWLRACARPVKPGTAAALITRLADALACAHRQGVWHRDLKPSNVLLERCHDDDGEQDDLERANPKLIDFGLAKLDEGSRHETRTGALVGTPPYMAPEQATGQVRQIGPATDVYGLGAILYELLTGRPAFRGESDVATLRLVVESDPQPPRKLRADVPPDLEAIVLKCLEKDPAKRYPTAQALADDLRRYQAKLPTIARPLTRWQRLAKCVRRRPAVASLVLVSTLGVISVVLLNAGYIVKLKQANETAEAMRREAETSASESQRHEAEANEYLYAFRMREAFQSLEHGEIGRVKGLLAHYETGGPQDKLRGFEWYHLKRRLHGERMSLTGHQGEVYAVMFGRDGRLLSGGQDGTIRVWDPLTGRLLEARKVHDSCVNDIACSPDGAFMATASCDGSVKLWDAETGELINTLADYDAEVLCLAFSPDGRRLAGGGSGGKALVWDVVDGQVLNTAQTGMQQTECLLWHADGRTVYLGTHSTPDGHAACEWNIETNEVVSRGRSAHAMAANGADEIYMGGTDAVIYAVDGDFSPRFEVRGHADTIDALAVSSDGRWLASGSRDRTIRLWDVKKHTCENLLIGHLGRVQSLAFSPQGTMLASAGFDGTVKLWDPETTNQVGFTNTVVLVGSCPAVAISSDGRYLARTSEHDEVSVHTLPDGNIVGRLRLSTAPENLAFADGKPVLAPLPLATADSPTPWDVEQWQAAAPVPGPDRHAAPPANWSPMTPEYLFSRDASPGERDALNNHSVAVTNVRTGQRVAVLRHPETVLQAAASKDNRTAAVACRDGFVYLWSLTTGQEIARLRAEGIWKADLRFSDHNRQLVAALLVGVDGKPADRRYPDGKVLKNVPRHVLTVTIWRGAEDP